MYCAVNIFPINESRLAKNSDGNLPNLIDPKITKKIVRFSN